MNDPRETYQEMIVNYLAKELTASESEKLMEWVKQDPEHQALFDQIEGAWNKVSSLPDSDFAPNVDAAWNNVQHRIRQGQEVNVEKEETKLIKLFPTSLLKVAASVSVIFVVGALVYSFLQNGNQTIQVAATEQRSKFVLSDSSEVWLQPHSTLSYTEGFEGETREVKLAGEGFFEVKRNENKPFVVLGNKTKVQVLGTSFVVHSNPKEEKEFVVVATGKVQFSELGNEQNKAVLTPGDEAIFSPSQTIAHKVKSSQNAAAWKTDRLQFNNTSLKEVLNDLELFFGVKLRTENEALLNCRFTGDFESPKLEQVLDVISVSLNATYDQQNSMYVLHGIGCP